MNSQTPLWYYFRSFIKRQSLGDSAFLFCFAFTAFLIHIVVNLTGGYGIFRDEFYYIACSNHLAWGYVDQPPLSIAILWFNRLVFGDSLFALRLLPAIASAVVVFFSGLMTKELGGNRYACGLACCCVIVSPLMLGMYSYYSMNAFDILLWTLAFYLIILILKYNTRKQWLLLGFVLGLGLLNKISVLWLGTVLTLGLILTPNRKLLKQPLLWFAVMIALLFFLPHIIWQTKFGFPTMEFIKNATANKYVAVSPWTMFIQQLKDMNPLTFIIFIPGVIYFLTSKSVIQFRILPLIYFGVFLILVINKNSKAEYLGPMFPMLFAIGALTFERFISQFVWLRLKYVVPVLIVLTGILLSPFAIAILPVETFISYSKALGMTPSTPEKKVLSKLPQFYADMFGWQKMVSKIAEAYNTLTPEEKNQCSIIGNNYGEAGAVDFFGPKYNLPKAISGHNNYWLWGPNNATGAVVIRLGGNIQALKESYADVIQMSVFKDDYCMPYENNMPIWVCRKRFSPLKNDWAEFKHYE